jgi:imidazolonepropionase-like amidohydrolase
MAKKNLKTLYDAGVKTGFGTDSGPPRRVQGYFEHLEMDLMAEAGLKPAQILQIATRNSADFLGARDIGVLESGRWADLLVLNANPLDNIRNVHSIHSVYVAADKVD